MSVRVNWTARLSRQKSYDFPMSPYHMLPGFLDVSRCITGELGPPPWISTCAQGSRAKHGDEVRKRLTCHWGARTPRRTTRQKGITGDGTPEHAGVFGVLLYNFFRTTMDQVTPTTEDYWHYDDNDTMYIDSDEVKTPCLQEDIYGFAQKYSPPVYSLVFIFALVGNVLVLCVIRRYRSSQSGGACAFSLTDTFLLHLAISDLLLAFTLPLFAVQWAQHQWVFGLALCKISGAVFSLNRYSGILFLACISFDRYLAIVHAINSGWKRNTCHAQFACAIIWVLCLGLSGVDIYFKQVAEIPAVNHQRGPLCQVWFTENFRQWQVALKFISLLLGFGLPLFVMLYCYIQIFRSLCNATRRQKRKSLRLIISLVSVFVICWAPYNCFQLADSLYRLDVVSGGCQFGRVVDIGTLITESMGLSHCALNPLLYGFVGVKFRREMVRMFKSLLGMERRKMKKFKKNTGSSSFTESENTSYSVMA
ncbi:C-X-C chemokine receptor type 3-2 isoform 2-T2 [Pholidichthys leucotaenia]